MRLLVEINSSTFLNDKARVFFSEAPQKTLFSGYEDGDVVHKLNLPQEDQAVVCKVGMATAAALFPIAKKTKRNRNICGITLEWSPEVLQRPEWEHW